MGYVRHGLRRLLQPAGSRRGENDGQSDEAGQNGGNGDAAKSPADSTQPLAAADSSEDPEVTKVHESGPPWEPAPSVEHSGPAVSLAPSEDDQYDPLGAPTDSPAVGETGDLAEAEEPGDDAPELADDAVAQETGDDVAADVSDDAGIVADDAVGEDTAADVGPGTDEGVAADEAEVGEQTPASKPPRPGSRLARRSRAAAARASASGREFSRITVLPALLVVAWLIPAVPLLLAGSFALAPMLVISIPLALVLIVVGLAQVPNRWPASAQVKPGPGVPAPWWALLTTLAVAGGFIAWQIALNSPQIIATRDPGAYLQFGYWITQHSSAVIPAQASAFNGVHAGLSFSSLGFVQHGANLSPQFMAGLPIMLAAGFWAGGINAALLVPAVLGGLAVLSFGGLVGRLAGPRWAPAGAIVLALVLPEQYTSRSAFSETLVQILLFGGLSLLIDALGTAAGPPARAARWLRGSPGPATVLAVLGGLALGLTAVVRIDGLSDVLPAVPILGIMIAARKPQSLPLGIGLIIGVGYGLGEGYVLARPYLDSLSSYTRPFGLIAAGTAVVTVICALAWRLGKMRGWVRWALAAPPLRWLPDAAAVVTVLILAGFAVRPYGQTVRGPGGTPEAAYIGYLQRLAGLPLQPRRLYTEDTLYWVIWYIGIPALLLGVLGIGLLARRVLRAFVTWEDPVGAARAWALPLLIIGWVTVGVLWRPDTFPDQPWASRRLVPVVLPGLILAAVWAAAWLTGKAGERGAGKMAAATVAVACVVAVLLPTALTTFGIGVAPAGHSASQPTTHSKNGLGLQRTGKGQLTAIDGLCAALGHNASVVIVDLRVASEFTQLIRGACDTPAAWMDHPSNAVMQQMVTSIQDVGRHPVLLSARQGELRAYGPQAREILNLTTTSDAHELTRPPVSTWTATYTIWMAQPS